MGNNDEMYKVYNKMDTKLYAFLLLFFRKQKSQYLESYFDFIFYFYLALLQWYSKTQNVLGTCIPGPPCIFADICLQ